MPSTPASSTAGCRALVGQTFMHSPQRMQRLRKVFSSAAPGGRSSRGSVDVGRTSRTAAATPGIPAPSHNAQQGAAPREIDRPRSALRPLPAELDDALRAEVDAIHAQVALFGRKPAAESTASMRHIVPQLLCGRPGCTGSRRDACPTRPHDLQTFSGHAPQQRPAAQQPQHCAGGAEIAAPESTGDELQGKDRRQDRGRQPGPLKRHGTVGEQVLSHERLDGVGAPVAAHPGKAGVRSPIEHRVAPERQSADQERERIDETHQRKREHGGQQHGQKHDVSGGASGGC